MPTDTYKKNNIFFVFDLGIFTSNCIFNYKQSKYTLKQYEKE